MKTVEFLVRVAVSVSDEKANEIEKNPDAYYLDFPLTNVQVLQDGQENVEAKPFEFETMSITVLE